tara:strand:- start:13 stop:468 length:456 start_codon:yes stop_codon:yes gene_type:complete
MRRDKSHIGNNHSVPDDATRLLLERGHADNPTSLFEDFTRLESEVVILFWSSWVGRKQDVDGFSPPTAFPFLHWSCPFIVHFAVTSNGVRLVGLNTKILRCRSKPLAHEDHRISGFHKRLDAFSSRLMRESNINVVAVNNASPRDLPPLRK